jgi:hypothetical protein
VAQREKGHLPSVEQGATELVGVQSLHISCAKNAKIWVNTTVFSGQYLAFREL